MHWRRYTHPIPLKMRILFQELMTCLRKEYPSVLTRILKLDILISLPNVFQSPRMHNWTLWHLKCQRLGLYRPLLLSYSQVWRYSSFLELLFNTWLHMCEICIEWSVIVYSVCLYLFADFINYPSWSRFIFFIWLKWTICGYSLSLARWVLKLLNNTRLICQLWFWPQFLGLILALIIRSFGWAILVRLAGTIYCLKYQLDNKSSWTIIFGLGFLS